jgi:CheY-like chemotaxis protein
MSSAHKILLVDDNPADANLTCEVLATSEHPAQVSTVPDGEQALEFAAGNLPKRFAPT